MRRRVAPIGGTEKRAGCGARAHAPRDDGWPNDLRFGKAPISPNQPRLIEMFVHSPANADGSTVIC